MTFNIYRDIHNNIPYSIRKSNITIKYELKKYFIQYSLQKGMYILIEFGAFSNNLYFGSNSIKSIFHLFMMHTFCVTSLRENN